MNILIVVKSIDLNRDVEDEMGHGEFGCCNLLIEIAIPGVDVEDEVGHVASFREFGWCEMEKQAVSFEQSRDLLVPFDFLLQGGGGLVISRQLVRLRLRQFYFE